MNGTDIKIKKLQIGTFQVSAQADLRSTSLIYPNYEFTNSAAGTRQNFSRYPMSGGHSSPAHKFIDDNPKPN